MQSEQAPSFTFSDLVAGYVTAYDSDRRLIDLRSSDGRSQRMSCSPALYAERLRNLGDPPVDVTARLDEMLTVGRYVFAYGIFSPSSQGYHFEAHHLSFPSGPSGAYEFEEPGWWPKQLAQLARFYHKAQFAGASAIDFKDYSTIVRLGGDKRDAHVQETDTVSRLSYGMASAYLLTGDEDFINIAEAGVRYMRDHMRFVDRDAGVVYWYHGIDVSEGIESKLFASEFGDDYAAIPAYEQIYALAGPTQTYRITGDPAITADIEATLRFMSRYFHDSERGGWYSHVDPLTLSPHHESLGANRSRKNWNSVGDHAPAYLINLYLATGDERHADMLQECFDLIVTHFPETTSPFVQERFHADWSPDRTWGWQQDRAVVGHNLKIAWNLMRMNGLRPRQEYRDLADKIGRTMPLLASDTQRGGWYDVMDRTVVEGASAHALTWHDRKAWWQQEQSILAYLILAGNTGDDEFLRHAREASAFYNTFFLDHDDGGVYFSVLANGVPYLLGNERLKGSHSMGMYHAAELCLVATVYQRLLIDKEPLDMWFRPHPDGFPDRILRVAPDLITPGRVRLESVEVDGRPYDRFDPTAMTVDLPDSTTNVTVRATLSASR